MIAGMDDFVSYLYALVPLVNSWAYFPQALKLYRAQPIEVRSVSIGSWVTWLLCSAITLFYGLFKLHDVLFCVVAAVSVFWNVAVIILTLWKLRAGQLCPAPVVLSRPEAHSMTAGREHQVL